MSNKYTYRLSKSLIKGLITLCLWCYVQNLTAQESVFTGMQSNWKKAEKNFAQGRFLDALTHYKAAKKQKRTPTQVHLKMALAYVYLNKHQDAVNELQRYHELTNDLPDSLYYQWAESETVLGNYQQAIKWYKQYRQLNPDDSRVAPKIWRLQNVQYLYEDSIYFSVQPVSWNTQAGEYGVSRMGDQLIFVSDRAAFGGVKVLDGTSNKPFYKRHQLTAQRDSISGVMNYTEVKPLQMPFDSKFHHGPISFSENLQKAVFTQTSSQKADDGTLPITAVWVERQSDQWSEPQALTDVPGHRSIRNPVLSPDGQQIVFSANMEDSYGGRDLYRCVWTGSKWSKPENLGPKINTKGDENYPFLHRNHTLYFASNGHSGLGGFDTFEVYLKGAQTGQVKNVGYPVNTQYDDFGLYLDNTTTYGYISSNRNGEEAQDDIFYLELDLQTYPLVISGRLKYRSAQWVESKQLQIMADAQMQLIDTYSNRIVFTTETSSNGDFTLEIPYSSQYKIKIDHPELGKHIASLEIPKNKKEHRNHEIVVVEEHFATETEQMEE